MTLSVLLWCLMVPACVPVVVETGRPYPGGYEYDYQDEYEYFHIPPGHLPPPGECRIWYPDLPPGQQPPPGDCQDLRWRVPPGAWLIDTPRESQEYFRVSVYDPQTPRIVIGIRLYDVDTGRLIREYRPRSYRD